MNKEKGSSETSPEPEEPASSEAHGMDTTFFMSRGRHLMTDPVNELLAICERLIVQSRTLEQDKLIPTFETIAEAAEHLLKEFTAEGGSTTQMIKLGSMMESLREAQTHPIEMAERKKEETMPVLKDALIAPTEQSILLVDDSTRDTEMISLLLEQKGYDTRIAANGKQALEVLKEEPADLIVLDIMLPEMNGYQVLETLGQDQELKQIPVIMISGMGGMDSVVRCIEMGADDYLPKPLNPVLLRARIEAALEQKRLRDQEAAFIKQIQMERQKSDLLLLNILPEPISHRLKQGENTIVDNYADVTVLFTDIVGFSELASRLTAQELVNTLNEIFSELDWLAGKHGLEKIKTIGDAYMAVGGLPNPLPNHAAAVADMALDILKAIDQFNLSNGTELAMRIGIHTGPVVAGIIGRDKFNYDLWGDTVNIASRMESHGVANSVHVSPPTFQRLQSDYTFDERGTIPIKGKGEMTTYFLRGKK